MKDLGNISQTKGIIKSENQLSPNLSPSEASIVKAATLPKVRNSTKINLASVVDGAVASTLIVLGTDKKKYDENDLFLIKKEIVNDIFSNFSGLSFEEIKLAFAMGARGEFKTKPDDVVYFSVATVYRWLKSYITEAKREAMAKQARFEQDRYTPKQPTPEELKAMEQFFIQDCILKPYEHFLETGEYIFDNRGNVIYNKLDKLGVIPFSVDRKKEIFEKAKNRVFAQLESNIGADTRRKYKEIQEGSGEGHELVKSEAKDIALRIFFEELKDQEMNLEEFIELRRADEDE